MNYTIQQKFLGKKTVSFSCSFCNEPLVAPLEDAGTQQPCPRCANPFTTPGEKELREQQNSAAECEQRAKRDAAAQRAREFAALEELSRTQRARTVTPATPTPPEPQPPTAPTPESKIQPPRYAALRIAANVIMIFGIIVAALEIILGLFMLVGTLASSADRSTPRTGLETSVLATFTTGGITFILVGLLTGIFAIAFAQLLLAVRDMAINSFHIRHALSLPTPQNVSAS